MQVDPFITKTNQRVEIKPDVTGIYPKARAFMQGWVRAQKRDDLGYPMIYVEWDKTHWAYSGEADGWTMEAHFNLVEEPIVEEKKKLPEGLEDALFNAMSRALEAYGDKDQPAEESTSDDAGPNAETFGLNRDLSVSDSEPPTYQQMLQEAFEAASNAEAFYMVVATKHNAGNTNEIIMPHFFSQYQREDAMILLEATLSDLGAQAHAAEAFRRIQEIREQKKDE